MHKEALRSIMTPYDALIRFNASYCFFLRLSVCLHRILYLLVRLSASYFFPARLTALYRLSAS